MTILFDASAPVKPAAFGRGILTPSRPSASDRSWWAAESDRIEAARLDRHYDELAAVSAFMDRYERGLTF